MPHGRLSSGRHGSGSNFWRGLQVRKSRQRCLFSRSITKNRWYQPSFCTVGGQGPKGSYQPYHPCTVGRAGELSVRAHNTHETPITFKFYITQYIYSTYHTIRIPKGLVKSYIRATRTALGNCNPRSCRSKGIASCRTAEAAPGLQFFQYRSENGCARRWRAGGSHRWTRAT